MMAIMKELSVYENIVNIPIDLDKPFQMGEDSQKESDLSITLQEKEIAWLF
jgi:hypothetical protein